MAAVSSVMLPLGTEAPTFSLPDPSGTVHSLRRESDAPATVVMFICNHCPYVQHIRPTLAAVTKRLLDRGVEVFGIQSNDVASYPADAPDRMAAEAQEFGYAFPYLFDESQEVAKAYRAACTPDFYVFDRGQRLAYRGQFDDSRPANDRPVTGEDLEAAVTAVVEGRAVPAPQRPSLGCSIKWKPGNEP
jgi:peroxiredoxin